MREEIASLQGGLIVSVQAYPGEPLRNPETMAQMARACELGGAAGIRCQGLADIAAIRERVSIPVIGLWKAGKEDVYITPNFAPCPCPCGMQELMLWLLMLQIIRGQMVVHLKKLLLQLKEDDVALMADCRNIEDIRRAVAAGCDLVSTTLSHWHRCH